MKVLLDANALMMPVQFRIDLFDALRALVGPLEPLVIPAVIEELRGLAQGRGSGGAAARFGLTLVGQCSVVESGYPDAAVDEQLIRYAKHAGCMVLTNDRKLRKALLAESIRVISLKNQKTLGMMRQ